MVKNFKQFIFVAGLLMIAAGAQPVWASIWQWSTTAASNATADPSINWQENMAPSAVNDSARAMMAAIAAWRNDISGTNTTGGTASAYTLTTSEGVSTTPSNGQMISFIAHAGNNASATLQVDGGNTYPIWLNGAPLGTGTITASAPYRVAFSASNSAWLLEGGLNNPYNVPLGGIVWTTLATAPNSSFASANGQCISATTYSAYWVALGSPASGICAGGQFQLIDLRGRTVAGLDTLPGSIAANRMTSAATGCGVAFTTMGAVCTENQSTTLVTANLPPYTPSGTNAPSVVNATSNASGLTAGGAISAGGGTITTLAQTITGTAAAQVWTGFPMGGTSTPFSRVQPTMGLYPWIRVL